MAVVAMCVALVVPTACTPGSSETEGTQSPSSGAACTNKETSSGADGDFIAKTVRDYANKEGLTSVVYRVARDGELIAARAVGDTVTGVPATQQMHFRNGNVAFAYMGTLLLLMAEAGVLRLDDPVSKWLPAWNLPNADKVTLRMLVYSTSGYPDYVPDETFDKALLSDPFQQMTPRRLLGYAFRTPPLYAPGTGWNYAHTNYVILGAALEAVGKKPLGELLTEKVIAPMGLENTRPVLTPEVPEPVLHSFNTERGVYEDATYWNPSWQTAPGSVIATNICDMLVSAEKVGTGALLSRASFDQMLTPEKGELGPVPAGCTVCRQFDEHQFYGAGVLVRSGWIHQTPLFGGAGAVHAYLPSAKLAVAMVAVSGKTSKPGVNHAVNIWTALAEKLTPDNVPGR